MAIDRRQFLQTFAAAAVVPAMTRPVHAQPYPSRPIRLILPFAAGGPGAVLAHTIAQKLPPQWAKQVIVENIPAGGSNVGTAAVARAASDGHVLLMTTGTIVANPSLYAKVAWDPVRDFAPISLMATSAHILAVHPSFPASNVSELVAFIKANPGKLSYASPGAGTSGQLAGELFKLKFGLDLLHVPFNGGPPAVTATMGGHTPILWAAFPTAISSVRDGKLRAIAVTSQERFASAPDVPTMTELGFPDQESLFPIGMLAPAGTPRHIIDLWHGEIARIVALPDVKERLTAIGFQPVASTSEEYSAWIKAEVPRWAQVIRDAKIAKID